MSTSYYVMSIYVLCFLEAWLIRRYILIRSNKMQQYAVIYLLQIYFTCFGWPSRPSYRVHETVTAASGTGLIRTLIRACCRTVVAPLL